MWGNMKFLSSFRTLIESSTRNKWLFVSGLVVVPATVILVVVSAMQPGIVSETLTPGGSSSNSADNDKDSPEKPSEEAGSEKSSSPSASPSLSPSASSSTGTSSGGSPTSTREPTPFVESASQAEAKRAAATYLNQVYQYSRPIFSRLILAQMLRDDGYSLADANYAAGAVSHNWSAEAALMANELIGLNYSRSGLITVLRADNFTSSEANFAVAELESTYPDGLYWATLWLDNASNYLAQEIYSGSNFSEAEASQFLRNAGYTSAEVSAVLAESEYPESHWEISAELSAMDYYYVPDMPSFEQVESYLRGRGFTQSQIDYAMESLT